EHDLLGAGADAAAGDVAEEFVARAPAAAGRHVLRGIEAREAFVPAHRAAVLEAVELAEHDRAEAPARRRREHRDRHDDPPAGESAPPARTSHHVRIHGSNRTLAHAGPAKSAVRRGSLRRT